MKTLLLALLIGTGTFVQAQATKEITNVQDSKKVERTVDEKSNEFNNAEDLVKGLDISQDEAEKVWLKYTEYKTAKKDLMEKKRESMKRIRSGSEEMSDKEYEIIYRAGLETQRARLNLDESYYDQFLEIIPASKIHQLLMSERNNRKQMHSRENKAKPTHTKMKHAE